MFQQDFRHTATAHTLRSCAVFAALDASIIRELASICISKSLAKDQCLFCEGSLVQGLFVVQSGAIKLRKLNARGHEQLIHVFRQHECFGADVLLTDTGYSADAVATETSQVLMLQRTSLLPLLKSRVELTLRILWAVEQHVLQLIGLVDDLTLKDVQTRLAEWLIHHCPEPDRGIPQQIRLPTTKRLLAAELGVTSETLSRTFNKFRQQQLLYVNGRTITLPSPVALSKWVRCKSGTPDFAVERATALAS